MSIQASPAAADDLFTLENKWALVTGASRGIGLMIARGLRNAGARIILASRRPEPLTDDWPAGAIEVGDVHVVAADLSTGEGCEALALRVQDLTGSLHILVNNAGNSWGAPFEEFPRQAWDRVLDLNLKAPFELTRALLPHLTRAATDEDPARVINIGSIDGLRVPAYDNYSYSASKAALHHLTRVLAAELGPRRVAVNAIAPGPFESHMTAATFAVHRDRLLELAALKRVGRPEDMAGAAVFLASRAGSYITGAVIPVDGGISTTN